MKQFLKKVMKWGAAAGLLGFGLIQLVPYGRDHTNPPILSEPTWDNPETRVLAQRACFDCHSNETVWPWYSNVAPVSWLVQHDTEEGRDHLNFSTWFQGGAGREPHEAVEVIAEGEMPRAVYLINHPEARLTVAEKEALMDGLRATIANQ